MKPCGAVNKPGTCLWCGCKLRYICKTTYAPTDEPPRSCDAQVRPETADLYDTHRCGCKKFAKDGGFWRCTSCRTLGSSRRKITSRTRRYELPGFGGNGLFCTLDCSFRFALVLAREGRRLTPKK